MPGAGTQAGAHIKLLQGMTLLKQALLELPPGSKIHAGVTKAIGDLDKHVADTQETRGAQQTGAGNLMANIIRQALLQRAQQGAGGARPQLPPATPIPGA